MHTPVAEPSRQRIASGRVAFRVGLLLLAIVAAPFVYRGWNAWREESRLSQIARSFLSQVAEGRKADAIRFLSGDLQRQVEQNWKSEFDHLWEPTDQLSFRVMSISRREYEAEVQVSVARSGFSIQPSLHLRRTPGGDWKIHRIENVQVDPRWLRFQQREAEVAAEALANELSSQLEAE